MPFHQIVSAPDGVLTSDDENGSRQMKATLFNSADCSGNPVLATGINHPRFPRGTVIGRGGGGPNTCLAKPNGSSYRLDSFQAIVVETNGWPMNDLEFNISDIDAASGVREGVAVFGLRNGGIVLPNVVFPQNANLKPIDFMMPQESNNQLGLPLSTVTIPGVFVKNPGTFQCRFLGPVSQTCVATISFPVPVDSFVVIYLVENYEAILTSSLALLSPLVTSCGCRCRESNLGTREVTVPVPGRSGECTMKEASGPKIECDVLGGRWCQKEPKREYVLNGDTLPNGNLGCTGAPGSKLAVQQEFTPTQNFAGTV